MEAFHSLLLKAETRIRAGWGVLASAGAWEAFKGNVSTAVSECAFALLVQVILEGLHHQRPKRQFTIVIITSSLLLGLIVLLLISCLMWKVIFNSY